MHTSSALFKQIVKNNQLREQQTLSRYACPSSQGIRRFPDQKKIPDALNFRPIFYHDTDSIIHSRTYTRYIDKTQVFSLFENDHITHRVLHVQFVSKIARVIGRALRLNEDLIEAIALGHDLGHAPFGHDGEYILNDICQEQQIGYFCHNAQSVRAMTEIERAGKGLNLSLQVLDGILAHNGEMLHKEYYPTFDKTWDLFEQEYRSCFTEARFSQRISPMTLEGCVMRISDIIAYIGRDIEDAIELKLLDRHDIPSFAAQQLGNCNADIIDALVSDLIMHSYEKDHLEFSEPVFQALQTLLTFNREKIYFNPIIKSELPKVRRITRMLFDQYLQDLKDNCETSAIFGFYLRNTMATYRKQTPPERIVIDFMAGMTDHFLVDQFQKLFMPRSFGYETVENQ